MVESRTKKIIAILCVFAILLPYMSEVLAVTKLTNQSETAYLYASPIRGGGSESSGTLPSNLIANYDTASYKYSLAGTTVYKVVQAGDIDIVDALYCLNAEKSFPVEDGGLLYTNEGDFKNQSNPKVSALGFSADNYKAIKWLCDNFYLPKDGGSAIYKDEYLRKAFASDIHSQDDLNYIKSIITDDDIDVVQQWAMWYFTNPDISKYHDMQAIQLDYLDRTTLDYVTISIPSVRQELCDALFEYLVSAAQVGAENPTETYPSIDVTSGNITSNIENMNDGAYYAVGPFKVKSGTITPTITLTDGTNIIAPSQYKIKIEGESNFTTTPIGEILDKNYYVYVPVENNTIPKVQLNLAYNKSEVKVSLWENSDNRNQPLVLITRENEPVLENVYKELPSVNPDLALRKYIIKVNNTVVNRSNNITSNTPEVDASTIATQGGAQFKGSKEPITVKMGDVITYELRVYNEGIVKGSAEEIIDYLPVGLTLTPNSTINSTYGWVPSSNGRIVRSTYTAGKMIDPYKSQMGNNIDSEYVQLQCTVGNNIDDQSILTNIAEIYNQNPADADSTANSIKDVSQINMAAYTGADSNKTDLSDKNYYYKGLEDDDDFEKVKVDVPDKDFALRKYIIDIDGTTINRSQNSSANQPQVVLTDLASGADSTAKYLGSKEALEVDVGSIITYELRVYNEGNRDGTIDGIIDYLPEGLVLTPNSTINQQYGWQPSQTNPNAYISTYLADKTINAYEGGSTIVSGHVKIQCTVTGDFSATTTLTNIAEILLLDQTDTGADRDSQGSSINISTIDLSTYKGNTSNISDLSKKDNFYKGIEDDDDFEKVIVKVPDRDLALRKYIIDIDGTTINRSQNSSANQPQVDLTDLASGADSTAKYMGSKEALEVDVGSVITYELRVYNEGNGYASIDGIVDYLPNGLTLTPNSAINQRYAWRQSQTNPNAYISMYLQDSPIEAYDGGSTIHSNYVQIQCTVTGEFSAVTTLTNVAEIINADQLHPGTDIDSEAGSIDITKIDLSTYKGNTSNISDLSKKDNFYKGIEDDDDFEKVVIKPTVYDLNLKKFITKINGQALEASREPIVNVAPLKNGAKNADYTLVKTPITVQKGDVVTYKIRVYNEGTKKAYAGVISDYLPDGLALLIDYKGNEDWQIFGDGSVSRAITSIPGLTNNLSLSDFNGNPSSFDDVEISSLRGYPEAINRKYANISAENILEPFDVVNGTELDYCDVEITCIVIADSLDVKMYQNIAEIKTSYDEDGESINQNGTSPITDRDSIPGTMDPLTYPDSEKNPDGTFQDDYDVEVLAPAQFDLALQKFISNINDKNISTRIPDVAVDNETGKIVYTHPRVPEKVAYGDLVTYTIRVYNEGGIAGYAAEIGDYIPKGLEFVPNNTTNTKYGWEMIDKDGRVTTDATKAVSIRTTYLSKEESESRNEDNLLKAFDATKVINKTEENSNPDYRDIKVVFKVNTQESKITIRNIAEITENTDGSGEPIDDVDSTPDSVDPNDYPDSEKKPDGSYEDDNDYEDIYTKVFDLALQKFITKVNEDTITDRIPDVTKDSETGEIVYTHPRVAKKVSNGDLVTFTIRVYNEGEIDGYAAEIGDYIPKGLEFVSNNSTNTEYGWKMLDKDGKVTTDVSKAVSIQTTYLSKEESERRNEDNLLKAFDVDKAINKTEENSNPDYRDIKVVFKVNSTEARVTIRNIAEIVENTNDSGEPIDDVDSTPDSVDPNDYPDSEKKPDGTYQDDNDYEDIYIKAFDLALEKFITKVNGRDITNRIPTIQIVNNEIVYNHPDTPLNTADGDLITYTIRVYNEGEIDGYAAEIEDDIPEGLVFAKNNEVNQKYGWVVDGDKVKTDYLSKEKSADNLIKAFDSTKPISTTGDNPNPDFKDVEIVFEIDISKVKDATASIINTAEISKNEDPNGDPIDDIDSTPDNNDPDEDDIDHEKLSVGKFDLSLEKFITKLNDEDVKDREPVITKSKNGLSYSHPSAPLAVANNDVIFYTIRVYNEGSKAGYAEEVLDDLPTGLVFLDDNETNIKYGWKLYDKKGNPVTKIEDAVTVRTNYLSKEESEKRGEDNLLLPYDEAKDINSKKGEANPDYRDVIIAFQVSEKDMLADPSASKARLIRNVAEISDDADENGNPVEDKDSTPGNGIESEDDLDDESIHIKYFDLALKKVLSKVIITVDGKTTEIDAKNKDALMKVEVNRKKINKTNIKFVYTITVENQGEIEGYATEITDYIPDGLEFIKDDNKDWTEGTSKGVITTNALAKKLLKPKESASVDVTLKWKNSESNMGQKVNVAEISSHYNDSATEDIDSTPNNKVVGEDDLDVAPVLLSISTGLVSFVKDYLLILTGVLIILAVIIVRRRNIAISKRMHRIK